MKYESLISKKQCDVICQNGISVIMTGYLQKLDIQERTLLKK